LVGVGEWQATGNRQWATGSRRRAAAGDGQQQEMRVAAVAICVCKIELAVVSQQLKKEK